MTKRTLLILLAIILASCAPVRRADYPAYPGGDYVTASWYGPKFHGRPTSSGERFDMYGLTAAHKEMAFGTRLRVINPDNGESVVVTVNDRGPFIPGRDLDLSYGAAKKIGFVEKGVGRVRIEYLDRDRNYVKVVSFSPETKPGSIVIQLGSFLDEANAVRLKQGLDLTYSNVYIATAYLDGRKYYRVRMGVFSNRESAYSTARRLADEGYNIFITSGN